MLSRSFCRITLSLLTLALLGTVSCGGPPAFTGGIRDIADETLSDLGAINSVPVPNVLDYGTAQSGGSNNGLQSFEGVTGPYGIDDHPTAAVETSWAVTFDYSEAIDVCGSSEISDYVGSGGGVFTATCYVDLGTIG